MPWHRIGAACQESLRRWIARLFFTADRGTGLLEGRLVKVQGLAQGLFITGFSRRLRRSTMRETTK